MTIQSKVTLQVDEVGSDARGPRVVLRGSENDARALARHLYANVTVGLPGGADPYLLEVEHEPARSAVSSSAPSPWSAKGFSWDDTWSLRNADGKFVAMVNGQKVTILNDDLTEAEAFDAPEGCDVKLWTWNKMCELGRHTCTSDDAFPEVSL